MSTLTLDIPPYLNRSLGSITFNGTADPIAMFIAGDKTAVFSGEKIYNLDGTDYWFKFSTSTYDTGSNQTLLIFPQWAAAAIPSTGAYTVKEYFYEKMPTVGRKMCMIGDSITGFSYGTYFRTLLKEGGLTYDFAGTYIDTFGYRHNGVAGTTTETHLSSYLQLYPTCESYCILLGTNDSGSMATVGNLIKIAGYLNFRNPAAKINICTLLMRTSPERNEEVNRQLRLVNGVYNMNLVELADNLPAWPEWNDYLQDGIHPTLAGYELIVPLLLDQLE